MLNEKKKNSRQTCEHVKQLCVARQSQFVYLEGIYLRAVSLAVAALFSLTKRSSTFNLHCVPKWQFSCAFTPTARTDHRRVNSTQVEMRNRRINCPVSKRKFNSLRKEVEDFEDPYSKLHLCLDSWRDMIRGSSRRRPWTRGNGLSVLKITVEDDLNRLIKNKYLY